MRISDWSSDVCSSDLCSWTCSPGRIRVTRSPSPPPLFPSSSASIRRRPGYAAPSCRSTEDGLPVALQVVAARHQDALVLALCRAIEQALDMAPRIPAMGRQRLYRHLLPVRVTGPAHRNVPGEAVLRHARASTMATTP